jgi:hypothetical protein
LEFLSSEQDWDEAAKILNILLRTKREVIDKTHSLPIGQILEVLSFSYTQHKCGEKVLLHFAAVLSHQKMLHFYDTIWRWSNVQMVLLFVLADLF